MELIQQYRVHAPQSHLRHEKALSQREMTNYLSTLLLWPDDASFIAEAFQAASLSIAEGIDAALAACRAHDERINTVLAAILTQANEAVGYGAAVIERLLFAVRTRHDGDFYQAVAESLKYAFEVEG